MGKPYGIIYKVTNIINGKVYIGRTVQGLYRRKWSHESKARKHGNNMVFTKALRKYGTENFIWEQIEQCYDKEELNEMEFHYIKQYDSFGRGGL